MLPPFLREVAFARWEVWTLGFLGMGFAIMAFVSVRLAFSGSVIATEPPPAEPDNPRTDPFLHGSTGEKRRGARRKGGVVEVLLSDEKAEAEPWTGYVIDRSLGGLCLGASRRAKAGTILTLRALEAPPGTPWIEVKVRSCRKGCDSWLLGCQFVRIPPTGLLLLFG